MLDGVDVEDLGLVGPDGALPEYRYKSFSCKFRGTKDLTNYQISSKILVFLVCLMYFLKMTPLAVRHIIRFIGYNTIKSFHGELLRRARTRPRTWPRPRGKARR